MARPKMMWKAKLERKNLPKIITVDADGAKKWNLKEGDTMVMVEPIKIYELMATVPVGKLVTINEMRAKLGENFSATTAEPLTTGVFSWLAANAAAENPSDNVPFWRTLKANGQLNHKFPGGIEGLTKQLEAEGHSIYQKGKKYFVKDYEKVLHSL